LITVAGTRLHVRDSGPRQAPAVIMIHGFGSSLQTWEPWAQALQDRFRVITLDLPGSGLSEPDTTGDYTDSRSVAVLVALMDRLGVDRAALIGNSIGGRIAWTFASVHPDRVSRLVLISPDGYASDGFEYGKKPEVPAMVQAMRYTLPAFLLKMNLQPAYGDPAALSDAVVERYHDLMLAPGSRGALIARMQQTVLADPVPMLRRIQVPVLLLWGSKDAMIPPANAADYQRELRDSRLVTLPGLGHVPFEEAPDRSLEPVRAFLSQ
jgi:pimeloyl-ACP methyl ester carboxylesterase